MRGRNRLAVVQRNLYIYCGLEGSTEVQLHDQLHLPETRRRGDIL